jgi:hypothetical protein
MVMVLALAVSACTGKSSVKKAAETDGVTAPDTGFTGIKQFMSGQYKVSEVTFKNGVRDGLMKTFYETGEVRTTFWYEKGLKQDSARWYYKTGELFRTTPYKNDTVDGIQKQFYRTGAVRARIGYSKGMRTPFIQEYHSNGKLVTGYPDIVINVTDQYSSTGKFRLDLSLSDKSTSERIKFYRGELSDGRFDTTKVSLLKTIDGKASVTLTKSNTQGPRYISIIAEIPTPLGNRHIAAKKIDLPYNDLK